MAAIGSPHAEVTNRFARLFTRALRDEAALVNLQSPLRLDAYNEPEPDLMILRPRAGGYRASHPNAADVLLLVEVSETSLAYDRGVNGLEGCFQEAPTRLRAQPPFEPPDCDPGGCCASLLEA
jgi:hypothetical protein